MRMLKNVKQAYECDAHGKEDKCASKKKPKKEVEKS